MIDPRAFVVKLRKRVVHRAFSFDTCVGTTNDVDVVPVAHELRRRA